MSENQVSGVESAGHDPAGKNVPLPSLQPIHGSEKGTIPMSTAPWRAELKIPLGFVISCILAFPGGGGERTRSI